MESKWDFSECVREIIEFRDERDWKKFHFPKNLASAISIEASELEEVFLWDNLEDSNYLTNNFQKISEISDELADVLIYSMILAYDLKIDLNEAICRKIEKNRLKYPLDEK